MAMIMSLVTAAIKLLLLKEDPQSLPTSPFFNASSTPSSLTAVTNIQHFQFTQEPGVYYSPVQDMPPILSCRQLLPNVLLLPGQHERFY